MNCHECQRLLLTCDEPASEPMEVAAHLAECAACQEWHERLMMIESNVPLIVVPPSRAGDKLVRLFQSGAQGPATLPLTRSRLRIAALAAGAMAAAVLITVLETRTNGKKESVNPVVSKKTPEQKQPREKALAAKILECDMRLAKTSDPKQRVAILAELADVLHGESKSLVQAGGSKELVAMAQLYDKVLKEGVVARARAVPMDQRRATLDPIAKHLAETEATAVKMAEVASAEMAQPLRQMAAAARDGNGVLCQLMDEVTP